MTPATVNGRMPAVLVVVATLAMIAYNGLAATGWVNGVTPEVISDKYPTILTPAGYAFTIWTLIYVGMIAFSIYQILPANLARFGVIRSLYVGSCLLNCGWIFFWHRENIGVCLALITALLAVLMIILIYLQKQSPEGALFTKAPFGIYAGWVTAAAIVNLAVFLKYEEAPLSASAYGVLGVGLIAFAAIMSALIRVSLKNFVYALAVAWALTAIAIKQGGNTPIIVAAAVGVVICLLTAGSIVVDLKDSTSV